MHCKIPGLLIPAPWGCESERGFLCEDLCKPLGLAVQIDTVCRHSRKVCLESMNSALELRTVLTVVNEATADLSRLS